jgi:putative membrane protein
MWADVIPRDAATWRYVGLVCLETLPFMVISFVAVLIDWITPFPLTIGITPYEVGGGILGVLLVLRTNSGYDRWWEARKLWGGITNQCRSLATAAVAFGPSEGWHEQFVRCVVAFAHATRCSLRDEDARGEVARLLGKSAAAEIPAGTHVPLWISLRIASSLKLAEADGLLSQAELMQMERERMTLLDHLGGCERILKTPLPKAYVITIRQFLFLFLATLPFGILQMVHWLVPLVTACVALPLVAIDKIGTELQYPFSTAHVNHLPLDAICETIERNLLALIGDVNRVESPAKLD